MRLWPFYRVSFTTSLSCEEALKRLHAEIVPERMLPYGGQANAYVGPEFSRLAFVSDRLVDGAYVKRNVDSEPGEPRRRQFPPMIRIRIRASGDGALVTAPLRPPIFALVLCVLFVAALVQFTALIGQSILTGQTSNWWAILIPPAMIAFLWLLICFGFAEEAQSSEIAVRSVLER